MKTLILYYTKTGHTLEAVTLLAEAIREAGSKADLVSTYDFDAASLENYDSFIAVSPCWAGVVKKDGAAAPMVKALAGLSDDALQGKKCGAAAVHAFKGGDNTINHLKRLMEKKGCVPFSAGPVAKAGTPGGIGKGPSVKERDLERFRAFGTEFIS